MSHEHEIAAAKSARLLDGDHVGGRLHDTELSHVPLGGGANRAEFALGQHAATLAMPDIVERFRQRPAQQLSAVPIALQEIKRHALRRFGTDAGKATQGIDQPRKCGRVLQNGSFMPGGRLSPDMRPEYFSWLRAAIFRTASLTAATSRSSSMSLSSPSNLGSMVTFFASWCPFNVTFTMPAPDSPVTSSSASSAC